MPHLKRSWLSGFFSVESVKSVMKSAVSQNEIIFLCCYYLHKLNTIPLKDIGNNNNNTAPNFQYAQNSHNFANDQFTSRNIIIYAQNSTNITVATKNTGEQAQPQLSASTVLH